MTPTVGRVVYYNEGAEQYRAAIIAYVWSDTMVNLMIIDPDGNPYSRTSVSQGPDVQHWDWMPYQKQKAAAGDHNSESAEPRPEACTPPVPAAEALSPPEAGSPFLGQADAKSPPPELPVASPAESDAPAGVVAPPVPVLDADGRVIEG